MAIPATVLYYTVYDNMLCCLRKKVNPESAWTPMVAGSTARLVAVTIVSPIELVRTKMQSEKLTYKGFTAFLNKVCLEQFLMCTFSPQDVPRYKAEY